MHGAEGGSRLGHVKSDARRGLHHAAHRPVVTLPKRRKPEGRSRSGDRGELPHTATKGFARSYRINLRLLPELAFSSEHDALNYDSLVIIFPLDKCVLGVDFISRSQASAQKSAKGLFRAVSACCCRNDALFASNSSKVTGAKLLTSTPAFSIRPRRMMSGQ